MKCIPTVFQTVLFLSCLYFGTNGVRFYETHDFAEQESLFEKEPTSVFEYDRNGILTINGQVNGFFRFPGLPHENNNIGNSDATWKFCVKTNSSCKNGIKVCINYYPGYPQNCDSEAVFYSNGIDYHLEWIDSINNTRESWTFKETYANCIEHTHRIQHQAYLAGGTVPNIESTCDATLQIYGEKVPKCTWRWHADPEGTCDNGFSLHIRPIGLFQYGTSSYTNGEPGSVQGTHTWSTIINGEFKPSFAGWTLGQQMGSDNPGTGLDDSTTANGWSQQTAKTWNDIITNYQSGKYIARLNTTCDIRQRTAILQKIWYCGTYPKGIYEVKSGLFKHWDMSLTNETYAKKGMYSDQTLVLLKDAFYIPTTLNSVIHTSTSSFSASPKGMALSIAMTTIPALLTIIPALISFIWYVQTKM